MVIVILSLHLPPNMNLYRRTGGFVKPIFTSICILAGSIVLSAQNTVILRPVDTGRNVVTFNLGNSRTTPSSHLPSWRFAVKSNLLYAIGLQTPNFTFEYYIGGRHSVEATIGYNNWDNLWDHSKTGPAYDPNNIYKRRLDHFLIKADYRYWFHRPSEGHFVAGGLFYAKYRVGEFYFMRFLEEGFDYYGDLVGVGFSYGYLWRWGESWATEFSLGIGVAELMHTRSLIMADGEGNDYRVVNPVRGCKTYFGPTSAAIKIVYIIK